MPSDPAKLKEYPCFRNLADQQRSDVAELTHFVCYPSGMTLFEEGMPGTHLYLILDGEVEVLYTIGDGGPSRVDKILKGEILGCSCLVEPYMYTATTRSLTEIEVLLIDAIALRELMNLDPALGFSIQQDLIQILLDRIVDFRLR